MASRASSRILTSGFSRRSLLKGAAGTGLGLAASSRLTLRAGFAQDTPKKGGTYTFGTGQGFTTLDPHKPGLLNDQSSHAGIWNGLVKMNDNMEVQPDLAESWENPDPLTYIFHLRTGVKFHNGREMTADDVVFSLDRVKDTATGSRWASFALAQYDHAEAVDPSTIKIVNKNPFPAQVASLTKVKIVAKENVDAIGEKPIGTGPFTVKEFVQDDRVVLARFADYWDAANVHLDGVILKTVKDPTAIVQALKTGGVDSIWQISTRDAGGVQDDPNLEIYTGKQHAVVQQLMIDNTQPPFDNAQARKALSYATDREAINEVAFFGFFEPHWYDVPLPSSHPMFNPDITKAEYNLDKAKELFTAAGVTGDTKLTYQAISTANPEWVVVGEILQQSLAEIGLTVEIEKLDLSAWLDVFVPATDKQWPARIISNGNVGHADPATFFNGFRNVPENYNHYQNTAAQDLMDKAAITVDEAERKSLYFQAQALMADDPACPFPYVQHGLYGKTKALKGFYSESDWVPHYENAWLDR
ncbi:MAG: peptide/nickel transport system substrate-binding protein [Thermomicrobiales bacterium]|nr:peptide/nickel transport system substrate-binding protein [Thermomicrobiales bacterium]